jgi:alkanesulfonate monooxygenase SsuD/methylene tetrahydromethanopterin reductase-like flavin-dependent oxidoreductase (luciferase family)
MVKVIVQLYPVVRAEDEDERRRLRPLGRNVARYQEAVRDSVDVVKAADRLGLWGVGTIEHHFHSEGYEVGPSPGMLNAYWAAVTERVRVGQLGYTMSAQNPIRVAEDTAILDHLTQGRCFVGFSRGYQNRWTNVLGQHLGTVATMSDHSADDALNRRIFEEQVDMVLEAWTQDSIDHKSDLWQIPFPYETGVEGWPMAKWTAEMGAEGEVGEDGNIHRISVVPAPYTQPHPPVFVASNSSSETVEYAGRKGFIPTYFAGIGSAANSGPLYVEGARSAGRDVALGQSQAIVRWPQIADSMADARDMVKEYDSDIFKHFYGSFLPPMNTGKEAPIMPEGIRAKSDEVVEAVLKTGLWVIGDVPQVRDAFVDQWKQLPAEYVVLIMHVAQMPVDVATRNLELFMTEIKPALDELVDYEDDGEPDVVVTTAG